MRQILTAWWSILVVVVFPSLYLYYTAAANLTAVMSFLPIWAFLYSVMILTCGVLQQSGRYLAGIIRNTLCTLMYEVLRILYLEFLRKHSTAVLMKSYIHTE